MSCPHPEWFCFMSPWVFLCPVTGRVPCVAKSCFTDGSIPGNCLVPAGTTESGGTHTRRDQPGWHLSAPGSIEVIKWVAFPGHVRKSPAMEAGFAAGRWRGRGTDGGKQRRQ